MISKKEHIQFIKDHPCFVVNCSHAIFSTEELKLLSDYGHWFMALTNGTLEPITQTQMDFIKVATFNKLPKSIAENVWFKYLQRVKMESDPEQSRKLQLNYQNDEDTFYNRDMAKKMKKMMSSEMGKNHRS